MKQYKGSIKTRVAVLLAAAVSGAMAVTLAHAQVAEKFRKLDANGDGTLTKAEVAHVPGMAAAFDEADDNHDGKLSSDEFIKAESIYDRQQAGIYIGDAELTAKVKARLLREQGLKAADVHVETERGTVRLSGWVDTSEQQASAVKLAQLVPGVKQVKDGLNVR